MPNTHVTKNYMAHGGDELVIGGKLTILEGASVDDQSGSISGGGGSSYTLPTATADILGGVKAQAKSNESVPVAVDGDGNLYVPAYPKAPANATASKAGLVKQATAVEDAADTEGATLQTTLNGLLAALRTAGVLAASPD